jgi:organic radical activating enzyme
MRCDANIIEVFSSLQGEGVFVGAPQIFIRFGGCNLRCRYCDTTESLTSAKCARIETKPFSGRYVTLANPVAAPLLLKMVSGLIKSWPDYHSISITGGEPLLHTGFLKQILPSLRKRLPILLETNGILTGRLKVVINLVDIVSMDIKLLSDVIPSSVIASEPAGRARQSQHWHNIEQFLRLAATKPQSYVKIVITGNAARDELLTACRIIRKINKDMPVILQPATKLPSHKGFKAPAPAKLLESYKIMSRGLSDVRIIPQVHRLMKWK